MKKTLADGSVLEGTPSEIAEYERPMFKTWISYACAACGSGSWFGIYPPSHTCGRATLPLPFTYTSTSTDNSQE